MWAMAGDFMDADEAEDDASEEMGGSGERVECDAFEQHEMRLEPLPAVGR